MIWIGTSGFQYTEWQGSFYPAGLSKTRMLRYYSEHFPTTEINYTFRTIPSARTLQRWSDETPIPFQFSLKAPQRITHFAKLRHCEELWSLFYQTTRALQDKLGVILFQLPATITKNLAVLRTVLRLIPGEVRGAFEFRDVSWFDEEVFSSLQKYNVALCVADTEDSSAPIVSTADFNYFRLRRDTYQEADLKRWVKVVKEIGNNQSFIYFKHEATGLGPQLAKRLAGLVSSIPSDPTKGSAISA